jgi:hypothetical protein
MVLPLLIALGAVAQLVGLAGHISNLIQSMVNNPSVHY